MTSRSRSGPCIALSVVLLLLLGPGQLAAADEDSADAGPTREERIQALAEIIDARLGERWRAEEVVPAERADDAEFLRRASLDLTGRIPRVSLVREFLKDDDAQKRARLVRRLLDEPTYVTHYTNVWRSLWLPESQSDYQLLFLVAEFDAWLRKRLADDAPYDDLVREIITVPFDGNTAIGPAMFNGQQAEPRPTAFFDAKEAKPENLASATARAFLGLRVDCAQCHDHPFHEWKREDFWGYAAFFGSITSEENGGLSELLNFFTVNKTERLQIEIPETGKHAEARYLDGKPAGRKAVYKPRDVLADWMCSADNPYFARAAANRLWAQLFGVGLVEPVDDMDASNPPSHPELLDALATAFAAADFDVKFLLEAMMRSRAYQLSSRVSQPGQRERPLFARMTPRKMSPEQLIHSLAQATGYPAPPAVQDFNFDPSSAHSELRQLFAASGTGGPTERPTTVLQALALMNGSVVSNATRLERSRVLGAVAEMPLVDTAKRVETLYLAALSRPPRPEERERLVKYVDSGGATGEPKKALGDVFWALLNSSEFILNH